jgi:hypothetical protein
MRFVCRRLLPSPSLPEAIWQVGNLVMQKSSNERYQRKSLRGTQAVFTPIGILHYCAAALSNFQS